MCIWVCMCMCVCIYMCVFVCVCICMCVYVYVCVCLLAVLLAWVLTCGLVSLPTDVCFYPLCTYFCGCSNAAVSLYRRRLPNGGLYLCVCKVQWIKHERAQMEVELENVLGVCFCVQNVKLITEGGEMDVDYVQETLDAR